MHEGNWHTVRLEWLPLGPFGDQFCVFVDNVLMGCGFHDYLNPLRMKISFQVWNTWNSSTPDPAIFEIDYVKVWQYMDCNATISHCNITQNFREDPWWYLGSDIEIPSTSCVNEYSDGRTRMFATNEIRLKGDFRANTAWQNAPAGSLFHAKIIDCPSNKRSIGDDEELYTQAASKLTRLTVFPNPFDEAVTIEYFLEEDGPVDIKLYDLWGRIVREVLNLPHQKSGKHTFSIPLDDLSSGIYFYWLESNLYTDNGKLVKIE